MFTTPSFPRTLQSSSDKYCLWYTLIQKEPRRKHQRIDLLEFPVSLTSCLRIQTRRHLIFAQTCASPDDVLLDVIEGVFFTKHNRIINVQHAMIYGLSPPKMVLRSQTGWDHRSSAAGLRAEKSETTVRCRPTYYLHCIRSSRYKCSVLRRKITQTRRLLFRWDSMNIVWNIKILPLPSSRV